MTVPSAWPGTAEREALIAQLNALRASTGLNVTQWALQVGSYQTRWAKLLDPAGKLLPTPEDLEAAVRFVGAAPEVLAGLTVLLERARTEREFGKLLGKRGGLAAYQVQTGETEARHTRIGDFAVGYIPALLATPAYTGELVRVTSGVAAWLDEGVDLDAEIEGMVAARRARRDILTRPGKQIQFVLAQYSLEALLVSPETLAAQLAELLLVMRLPTVDLRILSRRQRVPAYPFPFRLFDTTLAVTESIVGEQQYRIGEEPGKVAAFVAAFEALRAAAAAGDAAAAIIREALDDLGVPPPDTRP